MNRRELLKLTGTTLICPKMLLPPQKPKEFYGRRIIHPFYFVFPNQGYPQNHHDLEIAYYRVKNHYGYQPRTIYVDCLTGNSKGYAVIAIHVNPSDPFEYQGPFLLPPQIFNDWYNNQWDTE